MSTRAMRSPYAFRRALTELNVWASFLVRKVISTFVAYFSYLIGNTLYENKWEDKRMAVPLLGYATPVLSVVEGLTRSTLTSPLTLPSPTMWRGFCKPIFISIVNKRMSAKNSLGKSS